MRECLLFKDFLSVSVGAREFDYTGCHRNEDVYYHTYHTYDGHSLSAHQEHVRRYADPTPAVRRNPAGSQFYRGQLRGDFRVWLEVSMARAPLWPRRRDQVHTFYRRDIAPDIQAKFDALRQQRSMLKGAKGAGAQAALEAIDHALKQLDWSIALPAIRELVATELRELDIERQAKLVAADQHQVAVTVADAQVGFNRVVLDDHVNEALDVAARYLELPPGVKTR